MFNKISKPSSPTPAARPTAPVIPPLPDMPAAPRAGGAAPSAVPTGRGLSTLSSDLVFEGNVSGAGDLQIDGQVKGDVRVGRLIVGETGAVEGNVQADYVEVRGRVVGDVQGKQVKLVATRRRDPGRAGRAGGGPSRSEAGNRSGRPGEGNGLTPRP